MSYFYSFNNSCCLDLSNFNINLNKVLLGIVSLSSKLLPASLSFDLQLLSGTQ